MNGRTNEGLDVAFLTGRVRSSNDVDGTVARRSGIVSQHLIRISCSQSSRSPRGRWSSAQELGSSVGCSRGLLRSVVWLWLN
jgi:hypothetical protein